MNKHAYSAKLLRNALLRFLQYDIRLQGTEWDIEIDNKQCVVIALLSAPFDAYDPSFNTHGVVTDITALPLTKQGETAFKIMKEQVRIVNKGIDNPVTWVFYHIGKRGQPFVNTAKNNAFSSLTALYPQRPLPYMWERVDCIPFDPDTKD